MLDGLSALVAVVLCVMAFIPCAVAQTPPAGNAHPETRLINAEGESGPPFGAPQSAATTDPAKKHAFAEAVDIGPLRGLAVLHNGRVKVLDTLARETVARVAGRKNYQDFIHSGETGAAGSKDTVTKVSYTPLFTLLDLIIDPGYYADKPLIAVNYLPLRRAFLEAAFPEDSEKQERWMRLTRVTPAMVSGHASAIIEAHESEPAYREALMRLDESITLWQLSGRNMMLVAPERADREWLHISVLPESHPARAAALALGEAWRAMDAAKANEAIRTLAAELPTINAGMYPTTRRELEMTYNRVNAFEWGAWAYVSSLVTLLLAFGTGRKTLIGMGVGLLAVALGLHAFGFVTRCVIAERFAIQNQFESMTGLSLFAAVVGFAIMLAKRQWLFGAAAAGVGFLVLLTATQAQIPGQRIEREAAILNTSVLLKYHVTTVLVSYGLISLGFIVSLFYLGSYYLGRLKGAPMLAGAGIAGGMAGGMGSGEIAAAALNEDLPADGSSRERLLRDLDTAQMTVLQLAFWTLGVGVLLGAWWADHSWGRWWAFDPKETWALITWIVYLIVIHLRFAQVRNKGLLTAWLSVAGFFVMLWTYFGVNLILPGLHAYA